MQQAAKGAGISGLNPKVFLLFLALLPQFVDPATAWSPALQIVVLGLVHVASCAVIYTAVGAGARVVLRTRPAATRAVTRFSGVAIAAQVRAILPEGVDAAIELVGTTTLPDTLRATRVHGTVCFTGMLSDNWTVKDFYPIDYLPQGVRLTAYSGDAADLPGAVLQGFLDDVAAGRAQVPIDRVFTLEQIREAHSRMEAGQASGKLVVLTEAEGVPVSRWPAVVGTGPAPCRSPRS